MTGAFISLTRCWHLIPGKDYTDQRRHECAVNKSVDDYFRILLYFDNGLAAEIELGTFLLKKHSKMVCCRRYRNISG